MAEKISKGLGRGLGALLSTSVSDNQEVDEVSKEKIYKLKLSEVEPNKEQPRKNFEDEKLEELAQSIKEHGVIQPIIVVKRDKYYQIVAGERRWRAAKKAGIKEIPAIIRDDEEKINKQISLIENIQRQDLNPLEEAIAIKNLMEEQDLTQEKVAQILGKNRSTVANILRVLSLDENVKKLIEEGKISLGHCKILAGFPKSEQYKMALEIIEKNQSVGATQSLTQKKAATKRDKKLDIIYKDIEERFKNYFGTKVSLKAGKNKGKITIEYFSNEELERILSMISE